MDQGHSEKRRLLRILGPITLFAGIGLTLVGVVNIFIAMGHHESPSLFWCCFAGMPISFVGVVMCQFAFMGAVARYAANETAPVGVDTFKYVAEGTKESVKDLAGAVGEGLSSGSAAAAEAAIQCSKCGTGNDASASFCDSCGEALPTQKQCACGEVNDPDASFCDSCGAALT